MKNSKLDKMRFYANATCIVMLSMLFASCSIFRRTTPSPYSPEASSLPKPPPKPTTNVTAPSSYPATQYYGNRWNNEYVRITSDPKPTGTTTLDLTEFSMPVCGKVLSEFGPRNGRMHEGIDLKLTHEQPVYCAFDGMVRMAKEHRSYGKMVTVRHDNGLETVYSHLNSIAVKINQRIKAGDRVGGGGKTGNATGEHLHLEIRFMGEPFNPRLVIDIENCRLNSNKLTINENSYKLYQKNLQAPAETQTATKNKTEIPNTHTVIKGDTLYSISRRYGTTVDELLKINNLKESAIINVGQVIKLK